MTMRIAADADFASAALRLWWQDAQQLIDMAREDEHTFVARFDLPKQPGLLWYFFVLTDRDGQTRYYGNAHDQMGGEGAVYDHEPPSYQLTVYDPSYDPPHWLRDGVMYHIMVDRFCASTKASERPQPESGHWHADWYEPPELSVDAVSADNMADDFFGGDLNGIREKLPYLRELGVSVLYLSPIFKARSNHKYDTGDYRQIDPGFGTSKDFQALCMEAADLGMRVMLDGVFSHTGSDSRYFNRAGSYDSVGAYQSKDSPYASWYTFHSWPDAYESWWGFDTLPCVNKDDPGYRDFMIHSDQAVCAHWIRSGAGGWRLDVADELPMDFLRVLRTRIKREDQRSALLGEVWENASCKEAYGQLRSYCLGDTLDSCMNYPLREALIDFLIGRADAQAFVRRMDYLAECYPSPFFYSLMNLLSSHDRARAINVLADCGDMEPGRAHRSAMQLPREDYERGKKRLLLAWQFINAFPGMPSLYYADEAGAQGMSDPFCRGTYPWGREDRALLADMRGIIAGRRRNPVWTRGTFRLYAPHSDVVVVVRAIRDGLDAFGAGAPSGIGICAINRAQRPVEVQLPPDDLLPFGWEAQLGALSSAIDTGAPE